MKSNQFQNVTPAPMPQAESTEFLHTQQAGLIVPLSQALATGGIVFLLVLTLAFVFDAMDPLKPALVAGVLGVTAWWLVSLRSWSRLTKRNPLGVEVRSVDDDGDESTPRVIRVQLDRVTETGHYQQSSIFDLPKGVTEAMMASLANGILNLHQPFTELEWCGPDKPFSMSKFRQLRALLENRSLIEPKNPKDKRQGIQFNADGEELLRSFLP